MLPIALDGTDGVPAHSTIAITGLPQGSTLSDGRPYGETVWKLERDEIGDLHLVLPNNAGGQAKLTIQLIAPDATVVADAEILLQVATVSQASLPQKQPRDDAGLAPAIVPGVSPEIADAQVLHEGAEAHVGPVLRDAKPSAAATEKEEDRVPLPPRVVQSQRRAPAKTTIANVGTDEIKTSVFVNLRHGPSPSAAVIRVVAKGTKLRVLARKGRWVQVTEPTTSEKGWIYMGNAIPPRYDEGVSPFRATARHSTEVRFRLANFRRGAGEPIILDYHCLLPELVVDTNTHIRLAVVEGLNAPAASRVHPPAATA